MTNDWSVIEFSKIWTTQMRDWKSQCNGSKFWSWRRWMLHVTRPNKEENVLFIKYTVCCQSLSSPPRQPLEHGCRIARRGSVWVVTWGTCRNRFLALFGIWRASLSLCCAAINRQARHAFYLSYTARKWVASVGYQPLQSVWLLYRRDEYKNIRGTWCCRVVQTS